MAVKPQGMLTELLKLTVGHNSLSITTRLQQLTVFKLAGVSWCLHVGTLQRKEANRPHY